jgi:hypothetical protein
LSGILGHFATMTTIDTTSVTPLAHAIEIVAGSTRPDVVTARAPRPPRRRWRPATTSYPGCSSDERGFSRNPLGASSGPAQWGLQQC